MDLLLLINDDDEGHYCWIKSISRLLPGHDGHKNRAKRFYCPLCLSSCTTQENLDKHKTLCQKVKIFQSVEYPQDTELKFEHFKNQCMLPFIIYADTESILESSNKGAAYQEHKPISYCIYVTSINDRWQQPLECYTREDCMEVLMNRLDDLNEEIRTVFKKTIPMTRLRPRGDALFLLQ